MSTAAPRTTTKADDHTEPPPPPASSSTKPDDANGSAAAAAATGGGAAAAALSAATADTAVDSDIVIPVVVSEASRDYAKLFLDERPAPGTPFAEAVARGREFCVTAARRVGGLVVSLRRIEELALLSLDGQSSFQVRVYLPTLFDDGEQQQQRGKLGVVLYAHGGGTIMGCLPSYDAICRRLAKSSGAAVVSVGYRLAPEHPYPAALDDCEAAYRWMVSTLATTLYPGLLDPERAALVGDSAGGHLMAVLAVRLQRRGDLPSPLRPKAAVLIYPCLDFTLTCASHQKYGGCSHLKPESMANMLKAYLAVPGGGGGGGGGEPGGQWREELLTHPEVSALFVPADRVAATFPPTLLLSAECDPIVDDAAAFEAKLTAAGVPVRRVVYPSVIHGCWSGWDLFPEAAAMQQEACRWLREQGVVDGSAVM